MPGVHQALEWTRRTSAALRARYLAAPLSLSSKNHMTNLIYSLRSGKNKNLKGFPLDEFKELFEKVFDKFKRDCYFDEHLYYKHSEDTKLEILLKTRKKNLWPIEDHISLYNEDDLFDIMEFLYTNVSKPVEGDYDNYDNWQWETFNKIEGQNEYVEKINEVLCLYEKSFEMSEDGVILLKTEKGFDQIFKADIPTNDEDIKNRLESAIRQYRTHRSTIDDRRQAVRDLVDVLEYLRPKVKSFITKNDEKDLFNIANNFGIRHHNDKQKTDYDASLWLSWMFYFYLSTIHVILRKIQKQKT